MNKAVFLDRDGILNKEIGDYVWTIEKFEINSGIIKNLTILKDKGFKLIVITNQAGIAKGRYGHEEVATVHDYFQDKSGRLIDHFYYAPSHPSQSASLSRKPNTLLFEKGMAKFQIDPSKSWMVGDKELDVIPAKKLGIKTIRYFIEGYWEKEEKTIADFSVYNLSDIVKVILDG